MKTRVYPWDLRALMDQYVTTVVRGPRKTNLNDLLLYSEICFSRYYQEILRGWLTTYYADNVKSSSNIEAFKKFGKPYRSIEVRYGMPIAKVLCASFEKHCKDREAEGFCAELKPFVDGFNSIEKWDFGEYSYAVEQNGDWSAGVSPPSYYDYKDREKIDLNENTGTKNRLKK